ncbi:MAG: hypothetical protein HYS08_04520 [Chlamydiae bacterium]|nr:hypothetical protein [Chlamydiota bacterium]MBI3265844.1 hypothetical protein [Chlamydiota bacterium]
MSKKVFFHILIVSFFASILNVKAYPESSKLELQYVILYDDAWNDLSEKTVKSGSELTLQIKYTRKGFSKKSRTFIKIEIFDAKGNIVLKDREKRSPMEGTRRDRYGFTIPKGILGKFLINITIEVFQKGHAIAQISRTVPFNTVE